MNMPRLLAVEHLDRVAFDAYVDAHLELPSISVIGLGYVGAVSIACLSHLGFRMVGVDINAIRIDAVAAGKSPIVEHQLEELLSEGVEEGLVTATNNLVAAVIETDVTLISVGTPTSEDGSCDLSYVRDASRGIGRALAMKDGFHVVVLRCSVPPGTSLDVVAKEIEEASGKQLGIDFGICFNPEFLREGVAIADFFAPPKTVIGASDVRSREAVERIYTAIDKNIIFTSIEVAEMVKYVDNVWHATKVAFGNEIGRVCKALEIDSHDVMNIFVQDTKLNLSPYYLKPGFAFGGSCLPKEVRAVSYLSRELGVDLPLVDSLMSTNQRQVLDAFDRLQAFEGKRIGFLGLTFKPNTDDLRESPTVDLMAMMMDAGFDLAAYDRNLTFGPHLLSQIEYVQHTAPHLTDLLGQIKALTIRDLDTLVENTDVLVVSHATDEFREAVRNRPSGVHVLDLTRLFPEVPDDDTYSGLSW